MAKDAYTKALMEVMGDKSPASPTAMTRPQIEAAITSISEQLKGPLSNVERLWLVEDRQNLRKQLAAAS